MEGDKGENGMRRRVYDSFLECMTGVKKKAGGGERGRAVYMSG